VLQLPSLDIRDMLPEDREGHHFNKASETLDISRVQLTAYLDAAEAALRAAMITADKPPPVAKFRAVGTNLFPSNDTFGERAAMFFAKNNQAINLAKEDAKKDSHDEQIELALFRSAHWPYYGYPKGFIARLPGDYKVRFSARAVLQQPGHKLVAAKQPVPMTFRARKPSGPDVSGDVRATGGIMDVPAEKTTFETIIRLLPGETFEYSLLGLPVPLARNVKGGPPTYRYPPFPEGGQPGVAFQWLEVEGPISAETWPPASHRVLFGDSPTQDAKALLRRFVKIAAREPIAEETLKTFDDLIQSRLNEKAPFNEAMLAGYKAFLCSGHFLYLREPERGDDHFAIASRLSHFLTNTRPDAALSELAAQKQLRDDAVLRRETERLIASSGFERFIRSFTDYWLNLRHIRRDEPDIRLYPEYRFDDYLVESMELETRAFVTAMIRDNLPAKVDAVITKMGHIAGVVETKCRYGVTRANLRDGWKDEWLVTMDKIEHAKAAAAALCVPLYGFLFLVDEGLLLTQKITDESGQYCVKFRCEKTETQRTVNGGSVVRCNAFIDMSDAKEWR
jgi:hypothetical protein